MRRATVITVETRVPATAEGIVPVMVRAAPQAPVSVVTMRVGCNPLEGDREAFRRALAKVGKGIAAWARAARAFVESLVEVARRVAAFVKAWEEHDR